MVVHHTGSLHVGVADGGTEELEAALFHVLADGVRYRGTRRDGVRIVDDRLTIRHKAV